MKPASLLVALVLGLMFLAGSPDPGPVATPIQAAESPVTFDAMPTPAVEVDHAAEANVTYHEVLHRGRLWRYIARLARFHHWRCRHASGAWEDVYVPIEQPEEAEYSDCANGSCSTAGPARRAFRGRWRR